MVPVDLSHFQANVPRGLLHRTVEKGAAQTNVDQSDQQ